MTVSVTAGGVYYVTDDKLRLIPDETRQLHDHRRPALVVSGFTANSDPGWPFVVVCPISGSTTHKTKFDVQLAAGQGGVLKKCWVRIPAMQPIMKDRIEDRMGTVDGRVLSQVQARLAQYLCILDENGI